MQRPEDQFVEVEMYVGRKKVPWPRHPEWTQAGWDHKGPTQAVFLRFRQISSFVDGGDHCEIACADFGPRGLHCPEWHPTGVRTYGLLSVLADEIRDQSSATREEER